MGETNKPKYSCDNPPAVPISSNEITSKLLQDREFAAFIRDLLHKINSGKDEKEKESARACLNAWYAGDPTDLTSLAPDRNTDAASACTDRPNIADNLCTDRPQDN